VRRPGVTIVTTNWNGGTEPLELLASVRRLHYPPEMIRTVVVDNGSTDGSPDALARAFPGVDLIRNPENRGFGPAVNQGAAKADGEYLFITNDDIVLEPESLGILVDTLERDATMGAAGGLVRSKTDPPRVLYSGMRFHWATGLQSPIPHAQKSKDVDFIPACALLIRRSLWNDLGGFDERFTPAYWEDVDLGIRIRALGYRLRYEPTARFRHTQSASLAQLPRRASYVMGLVNRYRLYAKYRGRTGLVRFMAVHFLLSVPLRNLWKRDGSLSAELDAVRWVKKNWQALGPNFA
jgi:GT2 family glycosyltransferase